MPQLMKTSTKAFLLAAMFVTTTTYAETILVGAGSENYSTPFSSDANVTVSTAAPYSGFSPVFIIFSSESAVDADIWQLSARGGMGIGFLGTQSASSAAQTALVGNTLRFNLQNSGNFNGAVTPTTNAPFQWHAEASFDSLPPDLTADTTYTVSFNLGGNSSLLNGTAGGNPALSFSLKDGAGNALLSDDGQSLINLLGLPLDEFGRVSMTFTTGSEVLSGPLGLEFNGSLLLNSTTMLLGPNLVTFSDLTITASTVPEPASLLLLASAALALLVFRRRAHP